MTSVTELRRSRSALRGGRAARSGWARGGRGGDRQLSRARGRPTAQRRVDSNGLGIAVYEWGDEGAPPLFLAHGGMDFARTYDVFAPILADAGWRVVSWDQRGHGDSEHAPLYSWEADLRDAVLRARLAPPRRRAPIVGHSKGGSLMLQLADALPAPGQPPRQPRRPAVAPELPRRGRPPAHQAAGPGAQQLARPPPRAVTRASASPARSTSWPRAGRRMNPRLSEEWLRYLVTVGAREDADGWRWKIDPTMRFGGFGPWRPEWSMMRLPDIGVPVLAVLGTEPDPMGWGTLPEDVRSHLPPGGRLAIARGRRPLRPHRATRTRSPPSCWSTSAREPARPPSGCATTRSSSPCTSCGPARAARCCTCTASASARPSGCPTTWPRWPGPVWALDLTGHGGSDVAVGAGYFCEILMGDVDTALRPPRPGDDLRPRPRRLRRPAHRRRPARAGAGRGRLRRPGPGRRRTLAGVAVHPVRGRSAAPRWHPRPVGHARAHPRRPPAGLRRQLRPPGRGRLGPRRSPSPSPA